jgi:nitroreductase/dihydropteridine reductase
MEFAEIVMSRYATKKFDGRKLPEDKVNKLLEIVRFAPSALNLQPWKIRVVTDQKVKEQLKPATWDQEQITTCSHLLVFCANPDFESLIQKLGQLLKTSGAPEEIRNMVIGIASDMTGKMTPEQRLCWAQSQLFLALGNAVNGAKSLGFDSCPMGGFDPAEYTRILKIPPPLVPTMLCPLGYAADKPMPKVRFAKEEILF